MEGRREYRGVPRKGRGRSTIAMARSEGRRKEGEVRNLIVLLDSSNTWRIAPKAGESEEGKRECKKKGRAGGGQKNRRTQTRIKKMNKRQDI
jgi:hypothetical protein